LPSIAAQHGLRLTLGAWLHKDSQKNQAEIDAAILT
jgi:hypothetical protein